MTGFDLVLLLLSFVYALALGHLLSRLGALLVARDRVRFSGLLALAMLNAVTQVYIGWLAMWDFRDVESWDLYTITLFLLSAILIYLMCVAASPETPDNEPVDMEAFYWSNHRLFYGLYLGLLGTYIAMTAVYLMTPTPELAVQQSLGNVPFILTSLLAIFISARWAQWMAGLLMFFMSAGWAIIFSHTLG
ncbi:hypothetical protein WNY37_16950 [Henriciella sp. AS95]|uniref:hypothetical protein n=1 Tax=Henriciella sp. AS95 TaxID=3135782 RepID=UPI0031773B00